MGSSPTSPTIKEITLFEEVAEWLFKAKVSDFFVIHDEVREDQTDSLVAVGCVLETERGKREVFDDLFIEEVDDLASVRHVAGKAVRVPCQDGVVLAAFDVFEHLGEPRPDVRLFGAFLFFDDRDVFFRDTETISRIKAVCLLVRNGALLPLARGR